MSTRCIVAKDTPEGWVGRYVKEDGDPSFMIPRLMYLLDEKGPDRLIDVLMHWNGAWLTLNVSAPYRYVKRVSNYGFATDSDVKDCMWFSNTDKPGKMDMWFDYAYVIHDDGVYDNAVDAYRWDWERNDWVSLNEPPDEPVPTAEQSMQSIIELLDSLPDTLEVPTIDFLVWMWNTKRNGKE